MRRRKRTLLGAGTLRALVNPFAVLATPGVARLWAAGLATGVMRWLDLLAFVLIVLAQSGSPLLVALLTVARMAPLLFLSLPIASFAEGRNLRRLLLVALAGMLLLSCLLLLLHLVDRLTVLVLLGASVAGGVFWTLDQTLRRVMLAEAGGTGRVAAMMGVDIATNQATRLVGTVAGGALVEFVGPGGVFGLGIAAYALTLGLVAGLPDRAGQGRPAAMGSMLTLISEGFRFARREPVILATCAVTVVFNLFAFPYTALVPVVGAQHLQLGPTAIGALLAAESLGALLVALVLGAVAGPRQFTRIYTVGPIVFLLGAAGFALTDSVALAFTWLVLAGFGIAGFAAMQATIPLVAASAEMRLRAVGLINMSIGVSPVGFLLAGTLGELLGAPAAILTLAIAGLVAMLAVIRFWPMLLRPLALSGRG